LREFFDDTCKICGGTAASMITLVARNGHESEFYVCETHRSYFYKMKNVVISDLFEETMELLK